ncbi:MAG: putative porin [Candidatus Omnitrophica bacterium]|nr:putative porin [Candidatus Omnitrophota bacterium]
MIKIVKKIINSVKNFSQRMAEQEAEKIIDRYRCSDLYELHTEKEEKAMRKILAVLLVIGFFLIPVAVASSYAGEIDILLQKLVDKGILTTGEAQEIKTETQEQVKKEIAEGKYSSLPQWLQNTKLKGDFRLRYQYNHSKTVAEQTNERHRGRIRLRLGLDSKVNEKLLVALGLATGLNDGSGSTFKADTIRSTNQSFDNSFSKHPINLDYAYAKYCATPWITLLGGKVLLKDALWEAGDLMWDTDITPEGAVAVFNKKIASFDTLLYTGFFVFEEDSSSGDDPWLFHLQPIISKKLSDDISIKGGVAFDYFSVGNTTLNGSGKSNSWYSSGDTITPKKDVVNIMPAYELEINNPFKPLQISFLDNVATLKLFGEYVRNLNNSKPDDNKSGYMFGLSLGQDKIKKWGDWQISYNFARLEKDAVLDILPDSDRYGGKTNMRGHEFKLSYGLGKNTSLDFDIYRCQSLSNPRAPETLVQVDWNMKF